MHPFENFSLAQWLCHVSITLERERDRSLGKDWVRSHCANFDDDNPWRNAPCRSQELNWCRSPANGAHLFVRISRAKRYLRPRLAALPWQDATRGDYLINRQSSKSELSCFEGPFLQWRLMKMPHGFGGQYLYTQWPIGRLKIFWKNFVAVGYRTSSALQFAGLCLRAWSVPNLLLVTVYAEGCLRSAEHHPGDRASGY